MKGYRYVTIEREYASGGAQVGQLVGQALGVPVYGREILEMAAQEGGTTPEYMEHLEETDTNSLLYSLVAMAKTTQGQLPQISQTDQLNLLESQIIQRLAQEGPCVLVGRCAGWVLRERQDVLQVFVHADRETRLRRAQEEYGVSPDKAPAVLHRYDHRRSNFYHANTGRSWSRREGYHLVLDSGLLGVELCARIVEGAVQASREA
ncbi:MAG TPA: cytidylate kinase-like family protein [Candidatus Acutalibacter pullicola]|uniref:Cytidylate kinase-like family protein n=1 Tax=Candidatus Acutalibacter pullicola TaxID=2838417 RepID=A0A9D2MX96_9FIRM|nr:cytidylate kinase-like family protein [Candidatus Acutalibacter pullicola]